MKTLFILDASGYLYRSYFAIRNITNAKGESTNALFGFIRSVQKLIKDFNPEHIVSVFDGPQSIKKRLEIYPEYKAHRKETPQDLRYQINWAQQFCELAGIPFLAIPEVEADDTMGSIAVWAAKKDIKVYLCTSDKDLAQLVDDKIHLLNTHKENLILGEKEVETTYGVLPNKIIDLLSMIGDSSDNVPGIPGIGPKTAVQLLLEFGSLDSILMNLDKLSGKKKELITQHAELSRLSRKLVTIDTSVDFPKDDFFSLKEPQRALLKEFYASMNFNTLIKDLETASLLKPSENPVTNKDSYFLIDNEKDFSNLLEKLSTCKKIAFTTLSTTGSPVEKKLLGISFSIETGSAYYIPLNGKLSVENISSGLNRLFNRSEISFFSHHVKDHLHALTNQGIHLPLVNFDTMLASYILSSHARQHSLEHLMLELFGKVKKSIHTLIGKGKKTVSLEDLPAEAIYEIVCEDADHIFRLEEVLKIQLEERNLLSLLLDLELPLTYVLAEMEQEGIYIDVFYLQQMSEEIQKKLTDLEEEIYEMAGQEFNLNSPKQLSEILFTKLGIKAPKKTATGLSTNADVLESLKNQYPIAAKILEYRTLEKLRSTYIDALPNEISLKTKRVHCTFNQSVTATGRLSCQNPNLQNIPIRSEIGKSIRKAFCPQKEGFSYLSADYSQIELRILAHLSQDPTLIHAFRHGEDIHTSTAANIFNVSLDQVTKQMRYQAKAVNFGVVYGQQAFGLAQALGIQVKEAAAFIESYFEKYHTVRDYTEASKEQARQTGKAVTFTGRERLIPEIKSKNGMLRTAAERLAINTPLQGTAADLIKMAMLEIAKQLKLQHLKSKMILQIHDELLFEVQNEEISIVSTLVKETMENILILSVPLLVDVEVGKNWQEC